MFSWAVTFFIIALIAAVLGFSGIAGTAVNIAWILAVIGIILALVFMVMGRRFFLLLLGASGSELPGRLHRVQQTPQLRQRRLEILIAETRREHRFLEGLQALLAVVGHVLFLALVWMTGARMREAEPGIYPAQADKPVGVPTRHNVSLFDVE